MDLLAAIESSSLASALRHSVWVYPLINALHIAGVALLVGAIVPLDLRLLGVWREQPATVLADVLLPVAVTGLALAMLAGVLLFSVRATAYADNPWFLVKMAVVSVAVVNVLLLRSGAAWHRWRAGNDRYSPPALRIAAAVSLLAWFAALLLGRLVGYFG